MCYKVMMINKINTFNKEKFIQYQFSREKVLYIKPRERGCNILRYSFDCIINLSRLLNFILCCWSLIKVISFLSKFLLITKYLYFHLLVSNFPSTNVKHSSHVRIDAFIASIIDYLIIIITLLDEREIFIINHL